MPGRNRFQSIDHLGKDSETCTTSDRKNVTHFSLAVNDGRKIAQGNAKEYTEWINIEAWDHPGDIYVKYLHQGSLVFLEGRLKTGKYEDRCGETK
jgi:single-strand DNA-binding protein